MAQPASVPIEDGHELTQQIWRLLEAEAQDLGLADLRIQPIGDFLASAEQHTTSAADRQTILDQATLIFDHLYPHMPFKTDIYNFCHPSDYIRQQIQPGVQTLGELDFHTRMITAFSLVRDAHTLYGLPSPYRGAVAFLPFQIRPYLHRKTGWRFIVTSVMNSQPDGGWDHEFFGTGAEIVGWGELDVLSHVERTESHLPGGNYFASFARGALHATLRPLVYIQPPFQDETPAATIRYRPLGREETRTIRIPWAVGTGFGAAAGFRSSVFSLSPATAITGACGRFLHHRSQVREERQSAETQDPRQVSAIPEVFEFHYTNGARRKGAIDIANLVDPRRPDARFGYIRVKTFSGGGSAPGFTDCMVNEFRRILTLMDEVAPDGLVIDIRNNPGGDVQAAERMLQMLTPRQVQPARFHLANTPAVLGILRNLKVSLAEQLSVSDSVKLSAARSELEAWLGDLDQPALTAGERLTSGQPLTDPDSANDIGQVYHGCGVALLTNSLTYSAADIFAAGFQDHEAGVLIGTSMVTGGGGGNVWSHQELMGKIGPHPNLPLAHLPGDASMTLAIRRCTRVGSRDGQPVEDHGVEADVFYTPDTVEDVILGNPGLLHRACREFRNKAQYRVDAAAATLGADGSVAVEVKTINIASLRSYLNDRPALTVDVNNDARTLTIPAVAGVFCPRMLRIEGYAREGAELKLVRARTIRLQPPVPAEDCMDGIDSGGDM